MFSPKNKPRLPEIIVTDSIQIPFPSRPKTDRPGWTGNIYKTRPMYIARKISTEEFFGDPCKASSNEVLSQINEEKLNETDEPTVIEDRGVLNNQNDVSDFQESKNIFQEGTLVSSKYKEQAKGPVYNHVGTIIKHSIVGTSEMFERHQRNLKKGPMKESVILPDKDNVSFSDRSASKILKPLASTIQNNDGTQITVSMYNSQTSFGPKKCLGTEKKKEISKTIRVTKEDLYTKIDQMRQNQDAFYQVEAKKYRSEPLTDQLFHTKEQRCLEKFEKSLTQWNNTLDTVNRKIGRNTGMSVMNSSESYREKLEEAELFDLAKTESERFGKAFWPMSLRDYGGSESARLERVIQDIPGGFSCPQTHRPITSMETIKKPSKLSKTSTTLPFLMNSTSSLDRTRREYADEKSTLLKKEIKNLNPVDKTRIDNFVIEGKNKLEMEVTAFFNRHHTREVYTIPKEIFEEKSLPTEAEILAQSYDTGKVIRNGLGLKIK